MVAVFTILGAAAILLATNKVRADIVALLLVLAFVLTGTLTTGEAFAGFGNPVVALIAGLLVVSEGLTRTGVAHAISDGLVRAAGSGEMRLLVAVMLATALLGSVMNGTAVVAMLIPAIQTVSRQTEIHRSRLLLPLYYASLISGMLTLIATSPNLVLRAELMEAGYEGFDFFDFTPIGLAVLLVGIGYFVVVGQRLLPSPRDEGPAGSRFAIDDLSESFGVRGTAYRLLIQPDSPLVDRSLKTTDIRSRHDVWIIMVERSDRLGASTKVAPSADFVLRAGDVLVAMGPEDGVGTLIEESRLERLDSEDRHRRHWFRDAGLAVVLIHPESRLIGQTLRSAMFRSWWGVVAIALKRHGQGLRPFANQALRSGDEMLVLGSWDRVGRLRELVSHLVVLITPAESEDVAPARQKLPVALGIVVVMVLLSSFEVIPVVISVLLASLAFVATGCMHLGDAYRAVSLSTLVLVGGMLPAADALEKTGGVDLIVDALTQASAGAGPYVMMTVLYFATVGLGVVFSGLAAAILMAPVAIGAAESMAIGPEAFVMTVAIGASAAFIAPLSASARIIMAAGDYGYGDLMRVGLPLVFLTWLVTLAVTPLVLGF